MWKLCFDTSTPVFAFIYICKSAVRNSVLSFLTTLFVLTLCKPKHGKTYQSVKTCIFFTFLSSIFKLFNSSILYHSERSEMFVCGHIKFPWKKFVKNISIYIVEEFIMHLLLYMIIDILYPVLSEKSLLQICKNERYSVNLQQFLL